MGKEANVMKAEKLLEEIQEIVQPILVAQGFELVDLEYQREGRGWVLRLYIDREGGIHLDDCADVSRDLGAVLDVHDIIPHSYSLEVSSPGLTRPLKKIEDFGKYQNRRVEVRTFAPIAGQRNFKGFLRGMEGEKVRLEIEGQIQEIPFGAIAKANLEIEL